MKWFRLYTETLHNRKAQRLPPAVFKHWINLLCLVAQEETRGALPNTGDIAYHLGLKPAAVETLIAILTDVGLVDAEGVHNWASRQPRSDNAAERMANNRRTETEHPPNMFATEERRGEVEEKREDQKRGRGDATSAPVLSEPGFSSNGRPPSSEPVLGRWGWDGIRGAYLTNVGPLSEDERRWLKAYMAEIDETWIIAAINETQQAEKPCWKYFEGIMERCRDQQRPPSSLAKSTRQ